METTFELLNRDRVAEVEFSGSKRGVQKVQQSFRSVDAERSLTVIQVQGAQQPADTVEMVSVKMPDEDRMDLVSPHAGAHQLHLGAFSAVEQKHIAIADQRC